MASAGALWAAEDTILSEACPEVATQLQDKRCLAMAVVSFRIASKIFRLEVPPEARRNAVNARARRPFG
jgi:hypothetical protein